MHKVPELLYWTTLYKVGMYTAVAHVDYRRCHPRCMLGHPSSNHSINYSVNASSAGPPKICTRTMNVSVLYEVAYTYESLWDNAL